MTLNYDVGDNLIMIANVFIYLEMNNAHVHSELLLDFWVETENCMQSMQSRV